MIALDTNLIARYILRDDARQAAAATRVIETECTADSPGVITLVVLCELVWVLDRGYGQARADITGILRRILTADDLRVERSELAWKALNEYEQGKADFADYVIGVCGKNEKAEVTCTFDRRTSDCGLFRLIKS